MGSCKKINSFFVLLLLIFTVFSANLINDLDVLGEGVTEVDDISSYWIDGASDVEAYIFIPYNIPNWQVNKTFVKQFLKDNMDWRLQASSDNITWYNANELFEINLNWDDEKIGYKVNLTLNTTSAPRDLFYCFDFSVNKSLKSFLNLEQNDSWVWELTIPANKTDDYTIIFNWIDIKNLVDTGKVWFDRGIKDNFFWFRIQSVNKIPVGTIFVVDPEYVVKSSLTLAWMQYSCQNKLVCDTNGTLHCTFTDKVTTSEYNVWYANSTNNGVSWDAQKIKDSGNYINSQPSLAIDSNDNLYIAYIGKESGDTKYRIYLLKSVNNGASWSSVIAISDSFCTGYDQYTPCLVIDGNNTLFCVWYATNAATTYEQIRFSKSTNLGVTWSSNTNITNNVGWHNEIQSLAVDTDGNLYLAWDSWFTNQQMRFMKSGDGGSSWTAPINITNDAYRQITPCLRVDANGIIYLAFTGKTSASGSNYIIRFTRSTNNGTSWDAVVNLSETAYDAYFESVSIGLETSSNNVNILFSGKHVGSTANYQIRLVNSTNSGVSWGSVSNLTSGTTDKIDTNCFSTLYPFKSNNYVSMPSVGYGLIYANATYVNYLKNISTTNPPTIFVDNPINGSTGVCLQPTINVWCNDTDGDNLTVNFYENSTGSWVLRQTNTSENWNNRYWNVSDNTTITNTSTTEVCEPNVIYEGNPQILTGETNVFKIWYSNQSDAAGQNTEYAESTDGITWTQHPSNPIVANASLPFVFKYNNVYYLFNGSHVDSPACQTFYRLHSSNGVTDWVSDGVILTVGGGGSWDDANIANKCVWVEPNGTWYMLYEASDGSMYRIGLASSSDGLSWTKYGGNPVISKTYASGGPFVIYIDGYYYNWYHQTIAPGPGSELARMRSLNLVTWIDYPGIVFPKLYADEGYGDSDGAITDPCLLEYNNQTYMWYAAQPDNTGNLRNSHIKYAIINLSLEQLTWNSEGRVPKSGQSFVSKIYWNFSQANNYNTSYWWNVTVNDTINNVSSWNNFTTLIMPLQTSVDTIVPYWQDEISSLQINATSYGIAPDNVTLWYRWSLDNVWSWHNDTVDSNTSDVDSSPDKGTETNFPYAQNITIDSNVMVIMENNSQWSQTFNDTVDDNTADKDATADKGIESDFVNCQDLLPDANVMTLQETDYGTPTVNENKVVDGFTATTDSWTKTGNSPWLDADDDTNYISTSTDGAVSRWWTFQDTTATGSGFSVIMYVEFDAGDGGDDVAWAIDTNGDNTAEFSGTLSNPTTNMLNTGVISDFDTQEEINSARVSFTHKKQGIANTITIDQAYLNIQRSDTTDYELDMEYQFNGCEYNCSTEYLCLYLTGSVTESLLVDYYNSGWVNLGTINSGGWSNFTATGLTSATYNIRIRDQNQTNEATQHSWTIDVIKLNCWNNSNFVIDFEYQWIDANYTDETKNLSIYISSITGTETLNINYWDDDSWENLGTITDVGWKNVTATGLTSSTYTIQFIGATETSDVEQGDWSFDCIFLETHSSDNNNCDWMIWDNASNPDTSSPWNWVFDFPNQTGYYEFYSIGKKSGYADESPPVVADALCHYNYTIIPNPPSGFTATKVNRTKIDVSWSKGTNADYTYIRYAEGATPPPDRESGTFLYNDTGTSTSAINLYPGTQYSFSGWSWNQTGNEWSTSYSYDDAFTDFNQAIVFSNENPANNSNNQELSLVWNLTINDPEGDLFNWSIECNNSQTNSSNDDSNGSKELSLSSLSYDTEYIVWVNASDQPYDNWTREWYTFTTESAPIEYMVINLNTLEEFTNLTNAINDADTLDGHVLQVYEGFWNEKYIGVTKELTIQGYSALNTTINGSDIIFELYNGIDNITIKNLNITGQSVFSDAGINIIGVSSSNKASNINISNCIFYNLQYGIECEHDINNLTIFNNSFMEFNYGISATETTNNVTITDCYFFKHDAYPTTFYMSENITISNCIFETYYDVTFNEVQNSTVTNCLFWYGTGMYYENNNVNVQITNNEYYANDSATPLAIDIDGTNVIIDNNLISEYSYPVYLSYGSSNINISNNNFIGDIRGEFCIELDNIDNCTIYNNTITNYSLGASSFGVSLDSTPHNVTVTKNNITNCDYGILVNYAYDTIIYNNYFNNTINANTTNDLTGYNVSWNTTKQLGTNIIGGSYLGGNFWYDYLGEDTTGDGLGDTLIPYNCSGNITSGGDYLPLTEVSIPSIDVEVSPDTWIMGEIYVNTFIQENFTFWQNGSANIDITIGINNTNFTFVNYTSWLNLGHDRYCANFTIDNWVSENMIEPGYPATTILKNNFAPGSFSFGIRIWMPRTITYLSKQEDFEIILTVSEST